MTDIHKTESHANIVQVSFISNCYVQSSTIVINYCSISDSRNKFELDSAISIYSLVQVGMVTCIDNNCQ